MKRWRGTEIHTYSQYTIAFCKGTFRTVTLYTIYVQLSVAIFTSILP